MYSYNHEYFILLSSLTELVSHETKGRRSSYCLDTELMKVTLFCHAACPQAIHRKHFALLEVST